MSVMFANFEISLSTYIVLYCNFVLRTLQQEPRVEIVLFFESKEPDEGSDDKDD